MIIKENEVEQFDFDGLKIKDYTAALMRIPRLH